jgi:hypothetical protein
VDDLVREMKELKEQQRRIELLAQTAIETSRNSAAPPSRRRYNYVPFEPFSGGLTDNVVAENIGGGDDGGAGGGGGDGVGGLSENGVDNGNENENTSTGEREGVENTGRSSSVNMSFPGE